ncbi:bifunctional hydroxymethylpyrimidine kinase/phosphomethylpyrimidine kinase [Neisseria shayeganii]|uniref:hydroxymethylpyrimidine kinase n=1 Tax=Neisseria shayeganii TaxID=607712 RepID=A0A7D7SQN6_9NEIS|nr:bifunctional hydroxymethylpyrimidine kinase/phosphomethylpyrimidine kinase [Neisseria shayeganii]QMT41210.1 bifunctional hydroxymethylpyrimidine kinase/phosphomethylpyrimidine kinase [Neisseria shayeganii]
MSLPAPFPRVLTIAGSDSGGGAGIQADLKTFGALGTYGASVITAVTVQNTQGVQGVHVLPPDIIEAQADSVLGDIRIDAVKIGILPDAACIRAAAAVLRRHPVPFVVLDPVLVATSGDSLAVEDTVSLMLTELMPLADLITPNLSELARLSGQPQAADEDEMLAQGRLLLAQGARAVLLKGGHWEDSSQARDWLLTADGQTHPFSSPRIDTPHTHGTGCTLSSAIAALRPQHDSLPAAVAEAKRYLHGALETGSRWQLGRGRGPLAHFWRQPHGQEH